MEGPNVTLYDTPPAALEMGPPATDPDPAPVVTDTWVVRAVVLSLAAITLAVVITSGVLIALERAPLPGGIEAIAPTGVGALGALLAGTLTKRT